MSNVIQLLQKIGEDAVLKSTGPSTIADAAERNEISAELADALLAGDQGRLVALLGASTNVFCAVLPAKDDDDADEEKQDDDGDDPKKDEAEKSRLRLPRRASFAV